MTDLATAAFMLGVVAYSVATTLFFLDLSRKDTIPLAKVWAPVALGIGALLHGTHVVTASLLTRVCPVESLHFALSLSALISVVAFLFMPRRTTMHAMGAVVAPLALTFLVGAQFVGAQRSVSEGSRTLLALHITANLLGVGLFLLAGAAGAFYLVQERRLKEKRLGGLVAKLPPLDSLDRAEHRLLLAGFPLLTFGIVTGAVFAAKLGNATPAEALRAGLGYATWVLVAAVLLMRAIAGWRGRRSAYGTLAGVLCVMLVMAMYVFRIGGGAG
ncbi:MAG: cytochrome c biogenesis protein CcsA [Polyangiaceae bacterium]